MSPLDPSRDLGTPVDPASATAPPAGPAGGPAPRRLSPVPRSAPAERPSPVPRAAAGEPGAVVPAPRPAGPAEGPAGPAEEPAAQAEAAPAGKPVARGRHRAPASPHRRTALLLAGALVATVSAGLVSQSGTAPAGASGAGASRAVSVAAELGLASAARDLSTPVVTARLGELAASRAAREADEAAAARTQADAVAAAQAAAAEAARPKTVLPVPVGTRLTSGFGPRWGTLHAGIDLAAPLGTPEYAAADGVVLRAGPASGFGQAVYIQHANGDVTVYGHMEKILVTDGQVVRAGDEIALMGAEGEATGPHLHFEVHAGGITGPRIDPLPWLRARGVQI